MFNKILYFGSGTHLEPINHFSDTTEIIFGDSQPRTEFGTNYYRREFYRKNFYYELENKIKKLNLKLYNRKVLTNNFTEIQVPNLESECLYISDSKNNLRSSKNIKYYISTSLPYDLYDNKDLQTDIETCDSLLICGHHPNSKLIKYIKKPFNLIGYSNTWFPKNLEELKNEDYEYECNILNWIINNPHSIKSYTAVHKETGEKFIFKNYNDFYEKIKELFKKYYCEE